MSRSSTVAAYEVLIWTLLVPVMTNILIMSLVAMTALVIAFLLVRGGRIASARCPRCLRLGRATHCGRCRCSGCGAAFWLSEAGHSVQPLFVWQIIVGPLAALAVGSGFFVAVCLQTKGMMYAMIPALVILGVTALLKLYRVIRTKKLAGNEHVV